MFARWKIVSSYVWVCGCGIELVLAEYLLK